jgi:hypothetical protein
VVPSAVGFQNKLVPQVPAGVMPAPAIEPLLSQYCTAALTGRTTPTLVNKLKRISLSFMDLESWLLESKSARAQLRKTLPSRI